MPSYSSPAVAAALRPYIDQSHIAGAVTLVANRERVLHFGAIGHADIASGKPMDTNDLFWIASISKPFTAVALMFLVEEGKVALDAPVAQYLPEFAGLQLAALQPDGSRLAPRTPEAPITVRQILSMVSGMPFRSNFEAPGCLDFGTLARRVESYSRTPLDTVPGTAYQYSNAGINTAGRIVEVVSGYEFADFLNERLLKPLGLVDTTFWPSPLQQTRLATSYRPTADQKGLEASRVDELMYPLERCDRHPVPAGGLFATTADLGRFGRMLLNEGELDGRRYLSAAAVAEMARKQTPESVEAGYGLGFHSNAATAETPRNFGHGGKYATQLSIFPEQGIATVFMIQNQGWREDLEGNPHAKFNAAALAEFAGK